MLVAQLEREALERAAASVRWWPAALALLILGIAYALLSDRLTIGPPWVLLVVAAGAVAGARVLRWRGLLLARRRLVLGALVVITAAVAVSMVFLVDILLSRSSGLELLRDAALLWTANILTFSLWYWEVDGGGPDHRHASGTGSTDFVFPQMAVGVDKQSRWLPEFLDYLFLAFNTSTAFSPTDTMVLARRAKVLMMCQSLLSLVSVGVFAARAINTL
jgi:hypothetical protein